MDYFDQVTFFAPYPVPLVSCAKIPRDNFRFMLRLNGFKALLDMLNGLWVEYIFVSFMYPETTHYNFDTPHKERFSRFVKPDLRREILVNPCSCQRLDFANALLGY